MHQSGRFVAKNLAFIYTRISYSQIKSKAVPNYTGDPNNDAVDSFVKTLISTKSANWQYKIKLKRRKNAATSSAASFERENPARGLVAMETKNVPDEDLHDDENLSKEKIYPLAVIQNAAITTNFDKNKILKILESPQILAKVRPQLLEALAASFIKIDFFEGILQLEATSQRLPIPLTCNFIGLQFNSYKESNQNVKALALVENFYSKFPNSRREARSYLATIIKNVVSNHSEAVLIQCKHLTLRLEKNFKDCRPVIFLWHACFSSEWFSDQQLARDLLNIISKNKKLVETFDKKLMTATYMALGKQRPELVQNLIEDLIANNLRSQLTVPMRLLFDYKCNFNLYILNISI